MNANSIKELGVTIANDVTSLECTSWIIDFDLYEGTAFVFDNVMQTMVSYLTKETAYAKKSKKPSLIAFWNVDKISFKYIKDGNVFNLNNNY